VIPIILSSDQTQLTLFWNKAAYLVYATIGNIPKDIRCKPLLHAQILIAYLPLSTLQGLPTLAAQHRAKTNLFHSCMQMILAPILRYGKSGIPMAGGDGIWHRCHPIFTIFAGDYPEQCLVTGTYRGQCPKCVVPISQLGEYLKFPLCDYEEAIQLYRSADGEVSPFHTACRKAGLKPIFHPFWELLTLTNIYISITPDILHQGLQGIVKYLVAWITTPLAFRTKVIDARCHSLPLNHHIKTFSHGISHLSHVSGQEHKHICCNELTVS